MKPDNILPRQVRALIEREAPEDKDDLEKVWSLTSNPPPALSDHELDDAVSAFQRKLQAASRPPKHAIVHTLQRSWKIAASIALLAFSIAWYLSGQVVHAPPSGSMAQLTLPDGSSVVLNGDSEIRYGRMLWGTQRQVYLSGEAFFDIKKGNRPFIVTTTNANVRVLGTAFSIDTWATDTLRTMLKVTEGTVAFSSAYDESLQTTVTAGQASQIIGSQTPPSVPVAINPDVALLWLNGGIANIDSPLLDLSQSIERKFGIEITVDSSIQQMKLTWIQPTVRAADNALTDICELASCSVENTSNGFHLSPLSPSSDTNE